MSAWMRRKAISAAEESSAGGKKSAHWGRGVPGRWASLAGRLGGGLASIDTTLWPYSGNDVWTRIDLTLVLAGALLVAAALAFWPARRLWLARRIAALALLLAAYVLGLLDSDGGSVAVEGLLLLVLIWMWLWRPEIGRRRSAAAVGWLAAAGALAALLAPQLAGGQGWLGYRTWNLLGTTDRRISFSWDQTYGPLPWARSQRTSARHSSNARFGSPPRLHQFPSIALIGPSSSWRTYMQCTPKSRNG